MGMQHSHYVAHTSDLIALTLAQAKLLHLHQVPSNGVADIAPVYM